MTSLTDTPKRDEADLDAFETWFASLTRMERDQRFSASYFMREAWNAALRLSTPPSQGKVSETRINEIIAQARGDEGQAVCGSLTVTQARSAITQALTESSGQGTDGAEAMREALKPFAKAVEELEPLWALDPTSYPDDMPISMWPRKPTIGSESAAVHFITVGHLRAAQKAYSALPLPVSADGSALRDDAIQTSGKMKRSMAFETAAKECERLGDEVFAQKSNTANAGIATMAMRPYTECASAIRALKSKQPSDAGAGK